MLIVLSCRSRENLTSSSLVIWVWLGVVTVKSVSLQPARYCVDHVMMMVNRSCDAVSTISGSKCVVRGATLNILFISCLRTNVLCTAAEVVIKNTADLPEILSFLYVMMWFDVI